MDRKKWPEKIERVIPCNDRHDEEEEVHDAGHLHTALHTLSYLWRMIRLESRKVGITRPIWLIEKTTDSGDIFSWDTNKAVTRSSDDWNTDDCDS